MMLLATASFFACAAPWPFAWFFVWRFASGLAGGVLMVLAAPTVLAHVPAGRRGLAGGAIFTGVGLGIAASGTAVPLLLRWGLMETWLGLGALALLLTLAAWGGWPRTGPHVTATATAETPAARPGPALKALYLAYGLDAVGVVPHMVFLVDYVARGLGRGIDVGAFYWVLFGLGALTGPILGGHLADRIGFRPAVRLALLVQAVAVAIPALVPGPVWLALSSVVVGAFVPGIVPLVLGRLHELLPEADPARRAAAWSTATTAFALGQAAAAYGFSALFARGGGYGLLFALGTAALLAALAVDLAAARLRSRAG
jgi:predicted MFS family arabinose efflux permease